MTAHFTLPREVALDTSGNPISGAKLYFFDVGTTNPRPVYQDFGLTTAHGVFVQADANGVFDPIYPPNGDYDVVMTDGSDAGNDYTAETVIRAKISTQGPVDLSAFQTNTAKSETPAITKATDYTIVEADRGKAIDVNPNSATVTITLESAAVADDGTEQTIKHIGTSNAVLIVTVGSENIDDKAGYALTRPGSSVVLRSNGAEWKVKSEALASNATRHVVTERTLVSPPASPDAGSMYIMPDATLTGLWSSFSAGDLIVYLGTAGYQVVSKIIGDSAYLVADGFDTVWNGADWIDFSNTIAPQTSNLKTAKFEVREASGTNGGRATSNNTWVNRGLNYESPDNNITGLEIDLVTNPGRITVPAGDYLVIGTQAHSHTGAVRVALKSTSTSKIYESANVTTNTQLLTNATFSDLVVLQQIVSIDAEEDFEFSYYRTANYATADLGRNLGNGDSEIYATLQFIDLSSLQGPQGSQGIQGTAGADGSPGADGQDGADGVSNFFSQEDEPAGNDGDIWVKSSTGIVYKKISGTWAATATDLTGPEGPQGPPGADGAGTGDVVGPASSTDNAIARFDTTTGKLLQNSSVTIDDSGNIITSGTVDGRDLSTDGTKLDGIESSADVTDETNVTAALDGATLTAVTVATSDKVIIQDASDSSNIKTVTAQSIADLAGGGGGSSISTDLLALALKVADLEGDAMGIEDGIADPFDDETDVDTATSTNETYDGTNDHYTNVAAASAISGATGTNIGNLTLGGGLAAAFDGDTTQSYTVTANGTGGDVYIGKTYSPAMKISEVSIYSSNDFGFCAGGSGNIDITLYGKTGTAPASSTDGTSLGTATTFTDTNSLITKTITSSDTTTQWDHVWVRITDSNSVEIRVAEVVFTDAGSADNMTLQSNAFTADSEPTSARLLFQIEPIDSITINTDVIGAVSRDGGTTFTNATLAEQLTYSDGVKVYEATSVDISAQPSGTSMKWKLTTANNKVIECTGVVLQWS